VNLNENKNFYQKKLIIMFIFIKVKKFTAYEKIAEWGSEKIEYAVRWQGTFFRGRLCVC
jgi:hypothetical protein